MNSLEAMKKWKIIAVHVALWTCYILLYATVWRLPEISFTESLLRELAFLPLKVLLVYTCILFFVPQFLQAKRYILFILTTLGLILVATLLHNAYLHFIVPSSISRMDPNEKYFDLERMSKRMTYLTSPMLFGLTMVMIRNWYEEKEQNARIIQENLKARLQLLKQQLQPHFFFNTLNSLYSLSLQKSDQAPAMILKLSDLMRYLSNHQSTDWVTLQDEIRFLQDYLSIEEIRYQDKVKVNLTISIKVPECVRIPPLVLATFIENAFKHGVRNNVDSAVISVDICEDAQHIYYKVSNSKPRARISVSGTGLSNLHARLKILYGRNYTMNLRDTEKEYSAHLQLKKEIENS
jgi:sensor histidine kinase YesM